MFGRSFFDDDPFFADHRNAMNSMMRGFGAPFSGPGGFDAIDDGRGRERHPQEHRRNENHHRRNDRQMMPMDPFEQMNRQMNSMMRNFGQGMMDMRMPNMEGAGSGNAHSFSHSSVYTYSSDGQGLPKVFQAATEERRGPGGVRETKKAVKDSQSGMQKMAVGHHLGDRGHVIERSHNLHSGEREEKQDFIGLSENDGAAFNDEWTRATGAGNARETYHQQRQVDRGHDRRPQQALPEATRQRRPQRQHPRDQMLKDN